MAAKPVHVPDDTGQTAFDLDWIVSVDDHVIEPPHLFEGPFVVFYALANWHFCQ